MLNSDQVFDLIEKAAAESGRNAKEAIVAEIVADPLGRRVLVAALDPYTTYGIAKIDLYCARDAGGVFGEDTWNLLGRLRDRLLTGTAAREAVHGHLCSLSPKSAELLARIVTKDLRAGFGDTAVNKAAKGTIAEFPYMRCSLPKDAKLNLWDWKKGVFSQEKADGMFANVTHTYNGEIQITSRQGTPFPHDEIEVLVSEAKRVIPEGRQVHGELIVMDDGYFLPREKSNGLLNSIAQGGALENLNQYVVYLAWDMIPLKAVQPKGKHDEPYSVRFEELSRRVEAYGGSAICLIPTLRVHSLDKAYEHYATLLAQGKEGTIIKNPHAIWKDGTSKDQVKLKLEVDVDLKIVGFNVGTGKNASTFGSIVGRTSDDLLEVSVSGFSDDMRKKIHARAAEVVGQIMTVKANSIMKPSEETGNLYSLFLPRFVEIRTDKREADSLERVQAQFAAAIRGPSQLKAAA